MRTTYLFACLMACVAASGCASFDLRRAIPWGEGADGKLKPPTRVVAFWSDAVMQQENGPPMRGFAGRLMFYEEGVEKPIKVDGALDVYGYEEAGRDPQNIVPDRKFCFASDQMKHHYSKGSLGHSYSFWLPWDQTGGEKKEISLIARFTSIKGGIVVSEQAKYVLPGPLPLERSDEPRRERFGVQRDDSSVRQADYESGETARFEESGESFQGESSGNARGLKTTTIALPRRLGQRPPTALVRPRAVLPANPPAEPVVDAGKGAAVRAKGHWGPQRRRPLAEPMRPIEGRRASWRHDERRDARTVLADEPASVESEAAAVK